jgi:glycosyltransferase involved in cell wall biosynthesis
VDVLAEPLACPPTPTVSFFGRLEPYKGLEVLAQAMPRVWDHRPEVLLKVAGAGPSQLPLVDRRVAVQRGYLPETAIDGFFLETSLAVLPYTEASQTGVGSRAVGYGVPVVATRVGGLPDLTLDPTYLVDPGDDVGLAEAIVRHVDDGRDIRARVLAELAAPRSWDAASAKTLELYEQLLGPDRPDVARDRRGITSLDASILPTDQGSS